MKIDNNFQILAQEINFLIHSKLKVLKTLRGKAS